MTQHLVPLVPGWSLWRLAVLRSAGMPLGWLGTFAEPADADAGGGSAAVSRLLGEQRFLAALGWQNPEAMRNWIDRHARALAEGTPLRRSPKRDAMLARYAQRYCAKNDTIGFFGPVAWARFDEAQAGLHQSGSGGIRSRSVHFETWAIEALAAAWHRDESVAPHLPVRINPAAWFDGGTLRRSWGTAEEVPRVAAAVLEAVRAGAALADVSGLAAATAGCPVPEAAAELRRLCDNGTVVVGFGVALNDSPEAGLRQQVELIADGSVRGRLLAQLDELDLLRGKVRDATGDAATLHHALAELAGTFTSATGQRAGRSKADDLHGRTIVYEDCRRDTDVVIGSDHLDALRAPLGLVLATASWLARETGAAVADALMTQYARLRLRGNDVRLSELSFSVADVLSGAPGTVVHEVVGDFQARWAELLGTGTHGAGELTLPGDRLAALAGVLFPPGDPLWSGARYHSPDVMFARCDGRARWVLGELHVALNTVEGRVFHTQADDQDELAAAVTADMTTGRVVSLLSNTSPDVSPRTYPPLTVHLPDRYVYWSAAADRSAPPGAEVWPAAALTVVPDGDSLAVQAPGGAWRAPVLEVLGEYLTALVVNRFQIRAPAPELPRVLLGDMVLCRRSWRVPATDLPYDAGRTADLADRLRERGIPRRFFVRTPLERKPFFVDVQAPLLLRNMSRALRWASDLPAGQGFVDVTEMSPDVDETWLTDREGDRYCSEFRLVAVDSSTATGADIMFPHRKPA
jgi:hypothetical protein